MESLKSKTFRGLDRLGYAQMKFEDFDKFLILVYWIQKALNMIMINSFMGRFTSHRISC